MKTPEEMAQQYISTIADTHSVKAACKKAFIAGYKAAAPQWISVKDRLPEDASDVLIAWADGVSEACFCDETWCREGRRLLWVTHWMPLPEPPKEEE